MDAQTRAQTGARFPVRIQAQLKMRNNVSLGMFVFYFCIQRTTQDTDRVKNRRRETLTSNGFIFRSVTLILCAECRNKDVNSTVTAATGEVRESLKFHIFRIVSVFFMLMTSFESV